MAKRNDKENQTLGNAAWGNSVLQQSSSLPLVEKKGFYLSLLNAEVISAIDECQL